MTDSVSPVSAHWWRTLASRPVALSFALLLVLRTGLGLIGLLARYAPPFGHVGVAWAELVRPQDSPFAGLLEPWQRWDALWYQHIAESGYEPGDGSLVFFPLYPLLVRAVTLVVRDTVVAELLVSSAAFVALCWLLYRFAADDAGARGAAPLAVMLLALYPTGFFLLAPFSESLFLALCVGSFLAMRAGRPWLAGLAGLGASFARVPGALLALPLATDSLLRSRGRPRPDLAAAALPLVGIVTMTAYGRSIGETRSLTVLQGLWGARVVPPWQPVVDSALHIARTGDIFEIVNFASLVGFALLAVALARRMSLPALVFVAASLIALLTRELANITPLMSDGRYVLALFPVFVSAAAPLARRPRLAFATLLASAAIQAALFAAWTRWAFVG